MPRKYKHKHKRVLQRGKLGDHSIRVFTWQRMTNKVYPEYQQRMVNTMQMFKGDVFNALNDLSAWAMDQSVDMAQILVEEMEDLHAELQEQTPFDPEGPNDPPLHAAEDWKLRLHNRSPTEFTVTVSNRKHYIQFLEMHGGRSDHPGANEGGWIADAFNNFTIGIRRRIG